MGASELSYVSGQEESTVSGVGLAESISSDKLSKVGVVDVEVSSFCLKGVSEEVICIVSKQIIYDEDCEVS